MIDNKPKKTKEKQPVLESVRSKDNYDKICIFRQMLICLVILIGMNL